MPINKQEKGIYYTELNNPFKNPIFKQWIKENNLENETVLEPFAGANNIITMLQQINMAKKYASFDLHPTNSNVKQRNTIQNYPKEYKLAITNPPWLAKNTAKRKNLPYPYKEQDIYITCLNKMIDNTQFIAALIPCSYLQTKQIHPRIHTIIIIEQPLFIETEHPVCLTLINNTPQTNIQIYNNQKHIGTYKQLIKYMPPHKKNNTIKFNDKNGNLGLIAIDNTKTASIKFTPAHTIHNQIKHSSRAITKIKGVPSDTNTIEKLNQTIKTMREKTNDIFLTPFKGLRKDGKYRRRIKYETAKNIIINTLYGDNKKLWEEEK